MKDIFTNKVELHPSFTYKELYNTDRGAVFKEEDTSLLKYGIKEGLISVTKYLIAEKIEQYTFMDILESKNKSVYYIISKMKQYPQESEYSLAILIYLLNIIDPQFIKNYNPKEESPDIRIGYRFEKTNAFSRIYLNDNKISINCTNDSIENLIETLCQDGISLYIVDVDKELSKNQNIVAYKVSAQPCIKEMREKVRDEFQSRIRDIKY